MERAQQNESLNPAGLEIEDNTLTTAHIGREVEVQEPGRPWWSGRIVGWTDEVVLVQNHDQAPIDRVLPVHLHWVI